MYRPAGFWIRLGGNLLDGLIIGIPLGIIFAGFLGLSKQASDSWVSILEMLYGIIVPVLWSGYVIGKRIVGIRIVKINGSNVHFGTMILRVFVGGIIYTITLGIGLIVSAFMVGLRADKRSIHDLIAGTYVTYAPPHEIDEDKKVYF